jgi:hypothetical protein
MNNLIHLALQSAGEIAKGALEFSSLAAMILSTAAATALAKVTGSGPSLGRFAQFMSHGGYAVGVDLL